MVTPPRGAESRGAARCREVVNAIVAARAARAATQLRDRAEGPITRSEAIHQRALKRAIGERRDQRVVGAT